MRERVAGVALFVLMAAACGGAPSQPGAAPAAPPPAAAPAPSEPPEPLWPRFGVTREQIFASSRPELFGDLAALQLGMAEADARAAAPAYFAQDDPKYKARFRDGKLHQVEFFVQAAFREALLRDAVAAWGEPLEARDGKDLYWFNPERSVRAVFRNGFESGATIELSRYLPIEPLLDSIRALGDGLASKSDDELRAHFAALLDEGGATSKSIHLAPSGCRDLFTPMHTKREKDGTLAELTIKLAWDDCPGWRTRLPPMVNAKLGPGTAVRTAGTDGTEWSGPPRIRFAEYLKSKGHPESFWEIAVRPK